MDLKSLLITGAASGLGRALAVACSSSGGTLHLGDLNIDGLAETARLCRVSGANVTTRVQDVTDAPAMDSWIKSCGSLNLVLGCAGIQFTSLYGRAESAEQTRTTIEVNLLGAINTALPALDVISAQPADPKGIKGRIALIASLGAFVSVPGSSAYCASKAGIDNWTVGRSALARQEGVYLTSVCPGYIRTPLTNLNEFPLRGLMEPDYAAGVILRRLEKTPVRLAFPWNMVLGARIGGMLPAGFPARMLARNFARRMKEAS